MDTDADTDTATVNRVETFEFQGIPLELSSPHHNHSGTYTVTSDDSETITTFSTTTLPCELAARAP